MTREEAKEIIEDLKYSLDISLIGTPEINEIDNAISIAIKSLEAWEKYKRGLQASIEGNKECGRYDIVLGETIALKYLDKYLKEIENDK